MTETRELARFLVQSRIDDVPAPVRHEAARALLNWTGCAIGSSRHDTVERALAAVRPLAGPPQATVLGRAERLDILHAALLNGIASHVLDFDDTHPNAIHPSGPVAPVLLALAEHAPMSGAALVHAFILGVETEIRIGNAVHPAHYDAGWHMTGTAGVFGAAAAAGKALGLDLQQMTWALGLAATQSAGLREMFGSMCKSLHPGRAAQNGLTAALLAARDFTSTDRGIEAPRGFAHVLSSARNLAAITDGLGTRYALSENMYKPFACGLVLHAAIDGCIELRRTRGLTGPGIEAIELRTNPIVLELTGKPRPTTGLEGKFSIYHAAAVAIVRGAGGEPEFGDAAVCDPAVIALRDLVRVDTDPAIGWMEARVRIRMADGRAFDLHVPHALGSLGKPLADRDIEAKFRALVDGILPPARAQELIDACWAIESNPDAGSLARLGAVAG